jgi:hypothetical protein
MLNFSDNQVLIPEQAIGFLLKYISSLSTDLNSQLLHILGGVNEKGD